MATELGPATEMAVTMTAELADCFRTKRDGVRAIVDALASAFPHVPTWIYGTDGRFRSAAEAKAEPHLVAAANWMASATLAGRSLDTGLFVDVGSTTADIIPIVSGRPAPAALDDTGRLSAGELVYTGALRTPVCATVREVPVDGVMCRVAAEHFAIAADVHVWVGDVDEPDYTAETPDGRGRTRDECGARLARMVCADAETLEDRQLTAIAQYVSDAQVRQIASGMRQVVRRIGTHRCQQAIVAGIGAFLGTRAAARLGLIVRPPDTAGAAAVSITAVAVATLLAETAAAPLRS
jgi:probable H4MPT-linked C1 transfer pathway protein